jgi:hypothetical protein
MDMLTYKTNIACECCGNPRVARAYRWHRFRYCIDCLHSIGINAAGNYCSAKQYAEGWRNLVQGR